MKTTRSLNEAIIQGYVVCRDSYEVSNEFCRYCLQHKLMFVRVKLRTTYATIEVDSLDPFLRVSADKANEIEKILCEFSQYKNCHPSIHSSDVSYMYQRRVLIGDAAELSAVLVEILDSPGATVHYSREELLKGKNNLEVTQIHIPAVSD